MKETKCIHILFVGLVIFMATACAPRNINMLQTNTNAINAESIKYPELTIQKGDLLFIGVSSKDPVSDVRYNLNNYYSGGMQATASQTSLLGYMVDNSGNIKIADVGPVPASGLKTEELSVSIQQKLERFLKDPTVTVRFLNFKITVLGEVTRPGHFQIPTEKVTIIEALGLAGDLTVYGKRDQVMVIREKNGKREFGFIDLTKGDLFNSPYFYLEQNDAVYVYMNNKKVSNTDQTLVRNISLATGIISTIAIIITALKR